MKKSAMNLSLKLAVISISLVFLADAFPASASELADSLREALSRQTGGEIMYVSEGSSGASAALQTGGKGKIEGVSKTILKACKKECGPAYKKCKQGCYNTGDDLACVAACRETRGSCTHTCADKSSRK